MLGLFKGGAAERTISAHAKLKSAIDAQIARLGDAAKEQFAAECELRSAEASEAIGETPDTGAARRRLGEAVAEVQRLARVIGGLREKLVALVSDVTSAETEIRESIPGHVAKLRAELEAEWKQACAKFSIVMGKRASFESLIREKIALPEPTAQPCELAPEALTPWTRIEGLNSILSEIGAIGGAIGLAGRGRRDFDPSAVYRVTSAAAGFPVGTLVVEGMFAPESLRHLHSIDYVAVAGFESIEEASHKAKLAVSAINNAKSEDGPKQWDRALGVGPIGDHEAARLANEEGQNRRHHLEDAQWVDSDMTKSSFDKAMGGSVNR